MLAACGGAETEPKVAPFAEDGIAGAWQFKTEIYGENADLLGDPIRSVMTGTLVVAEKDGGGFDCQLRTSEKTVVSHSESRGTASYATSSQTCSVTVNGDAVTILGNVEEASSETYTADNFNLTYHTNWMEGKLSSTSNPKVIFVRSGSDGGDSEFNLFLSEISDAKRDLGSAVFMGALERSNCVNGYRRSDEANGDWRRGTIVFICDGERNGIPVRKRELSYSVNCAAQELYLEQVYYYAPGGELVDRKSYVSDEEAKQIGPYGEGPSGLDPNSPGGMMAAAVCSGVAGS